MRNHHHLLLTVAMVLVVIPEPITTIVGVGMLCILSILYRNEKRAISFHSHSHWV